LTGLRIFLIGYLSGLLTILLTQVTMALYADHVALWRVIDYLSSAVHQ